MHPRKVKLSAGDLRTGQVWNPRFPMVSFPRFRARAGRGSGCFVQSSSRPLNHFCFGGYTKNAQPKEVHFLLLQASLNLDKGTTPAHRRGRVSLKDLVPWRFQGSFQDPEKRTFLLKGVPGGIHFSMRQGNWLKCFESPLVHFGVTERVCVFHDP